MSATTITPGTINYQLLHWSQTDPTAAAFIFRSDDPNNQRLVLTRGDVFVLASRYAAILHGQGIEHGHIVCNTLPNSPERLLTDLGIIMAGAAVLNGVVFLADQSDVLGSLRRAGCVAVVMDPRQTQGFVNNLEGKVVGSEKHITLECPSTPALKYIMSVECKMDQDGHKPFLLELKKAEAVHVADVQPSDLAYIHTTSGSTGFSKMVPRTHASYLETARVWYNMMGRQAGDLFFNDRSLGWMGGAPMFFFAAGGTRVLTDLSAPPSDPLGLAWRSVWEEKVTFAAFVPLHIEMSLARPDLWQGHSKLHRLITGGQPVRKNHLQVLDTFADSVCVLYGSTEAGFVVSQTVTAATRESFQDTDSGVPYPGIEVKILDEKQQEIRKAGKTGEIIIRGSTVFAGYLDPEKGDERECFTQDGFFRSNDVGFWNSQGHLHVVCRKSNAIMHGAFIVYPGWLEAKLEKCPGIRSVVMVPVPDPVISQELCACLLPEDGHGGPQVSEEDVRGFCKSLFLVSDQDEISVVPRFFLFFESFPETSTGKTDRKTIKQLALQRLGLQDEPIVPGDISGQD